MTDFPSPEFQGRPAETFNEAEDALLSRWPETKLEPSLDRIEAFTELLGRPQDAYPVIHLTGTNGKTSTSRMIDTLLHALNLRTGRFTSPHVEKMSERISVDGEPLTDEQFVQAFNDVAPYMPLVDASEDHPLSFFEAVVGMAYAAFADAPVDVAVVEVGMGGSWDATNVMDAAVAVVLPISVDHSKYLGDTAVEIAREKAGIIKPGSFTVLGAQQAAAAEILLARVGEVGATLARQGIEFGVRHREMAVGGQLLTLQGLADTYEDVFLPLHGEHQAGNAAMALAAVEAFAGGGREGLDPEAVRAAFARVTSPGRLEALRRGPVVLVDAAHNPAGAAALATALNDEFASTTLVAVVAVLADKDAVGILEALEPAVEALVVTTNSSPRSMPAADLARVARDVFGEDRVFQASPLPEAIDVGLALAEREASFGGHGVIVTGSVVTAGDARAAFGVAS